MNSENQENLSSLSDAISNFRRHQNKKPISEEHSERLHETLAKKTANKNSLAVDDIAEFYRALQERDALDQNTAAKTSEERIQKNILDWNEKIEARWKNADIEVEEFKPEAKEAIVNAISELENSRNLVAGVHQTSMMFIGSLGHGKTWAAYGALKELIKRGLVAPGQIYANTEMNLAAVTYAGFEKNKQFSEILDKKYKAYFIDDVGRGKFRDAGQRGEIWFEIVNRAYAENIPLIITSNLPLFNEVDEGKDLQGWLGAAVLDRLRSMVAEEGYVIFDNGNMRRKLESDKRNKRNATTESKLASPAPNQRRQMEEPDSKITYAERQQLKKKSNKKDELF